MRHLIFAGASALALATLPNALLAQNAPSAAGDSAQVSPAAPVTLTAEQQAMYDGWPADRQAEYDAWPDEYKGYFWTLVPERQEGYWALTPDQRGQVYKMSPQQREAAWTSIIQQLNGQTPTTPATQANPPGEGVPTAGVPAPETAEQAVRPAMPADQSYQGGPYKGALTPPPASAMNKDYPVCSKTVQDNCRNPGGK
ncbi:MULTISPECIES: hypothetical protein [Novosphingobium]|uniref:Uncharacterized protein n=1 Tax=Novosphingobium mathurense TaxID=428990 RepID=A0A1U6H4K8_9SPHN|nr:MULTISPECIES: hypothetical protein [Novosphingobium]CDO37694.1 conserved exported hypothetical protein [Novosphingobium sp. KN65.2]SLJ90703.1 hypothetical protein SAMN06295987_1011252 [Novosphingobium mathurense]